MAAVGAAGWVLLAKVIPADSGTAAEKTGNPGLMAALLQLVRIRPAAGMLGFGFLISMASDNLFVVYGAWLEQDFGIGIVALGLSTSIIGAAELTGESMTAFWGDRIGLKRAMLIGAGAAAVGYLILPVIGFSLYMSLGGLFLIFFAIEFAIVCSFSLGTELMPSARATMIAGYFAAAGMGRMVGAFTGGAIWFTGGLWAVTTTSAGAMVLALLCLLWGLKGWKPGV
jgi:predicted MFS family arabinose efflux permease